MLESKQKQRHIKPMGCISARVVELPGEGSATNGATSSSLNLAYQGLSGIRLLEFLLNTDRN